MSDFFERINKIAGDRQLRMVQLEDGYGLDYGGGCISRFQLSEKTELENWILAFHPWEPVDLPE